MALLHAMVQASRTSPTPPVIGDDRLCRMKVKSQGPAYNCNATPKVMLLIDSERYDEDYGEGAMQNVVTKIREERRQAV